MRRFEFVQGTSAKFWTAGVDGVNFTVVFGRIGTEGQRKDKPFPSEDAARRELDKKIAEKLREGYTEVGAASAAPPRPAKEPKEKEKKPAPPRPPLPPRFAAPAPSPKTRPGAPPDSAHPVREAAASLVALGAALRGKRRSWHVARLARLARRALERIAGTDPGAHDELARAFDDLMVHVVEPSRDRLPLRLALQLLLMLDVAAFGRAMRLWQPAAERVPGARLLGRVLESLGDAELSLRFGALLAARPDLDAGTEAGWQKRWRALRPHLEAHLTERGATLAAHVQELQKLDFGTGAAALKENKAQLAAFGQRLKQLRAA